MAKNRQQAQKAQCAIGQSRCRNRDIVFLGKDLNRPTLKADIQIGYAFVELAHGFQNPRFDLWLSPQPIQYQPQVPSILTEKIIGHIGWLRQARRRVATK